MSRREGGWRRAKHSQWRWRTLVLGLYDVIGCCGHSDSCSSCSQPRAAGLRLQVFGPAAEQLLQWLQQQQPQLQLQPAAEQAKPARRQLMQFVPGRIESLLDGSNFQTVPCTYGNSLTQGWQQAMREKMYLYFSPSSI